MVPNGFDISDSRGLAKQGDTRSRLAALLVRSMTKCVTTTNRPNSPVAAHASTFSSRANLEKGVSKRPWSGQLSPESAHFLRVLFFLLGFLSFILRALMGSLIISMALRLWTVFGRPVAMDFAGIVGSTEGAFPSSDRTS